MPTPLVFAIGTRAQLIKVAPVVVACEKRNLPCTLLMTGQHQETMQDLVEEFGITCQQVTAVPAKEHASIRSLLAWLPAAYTGIKQRLQEMETIPTVLVHGDTLSTLISAIAAHRLGARVVHLESGLSSGRLFDPFPEEICRRLVFRMTDLAMCPNSAAATHMLRYHQTKVVNTCGNTIVDAVALTGAGNKPRTSVPPCLVVSLHRFQNLYNRKRLAYLVSLIVTLSARFDIHFVLHPATRNCLEKQGQIQQLMSAANVHLTPRMGYSDFLHLAAGADCVLTDGGSNQEELAALGIPTIVMRARTERPDGLGANARMEADISEGVETFVLSGNHTTLKRPSSIPVGNSPSARIAAELS